MLYAEKWIEQCEAAARIRDQFGIKPALDYLVQEKFLQHVEIADTDRSFATQLPGFVAAIRPLFKRYDLEDYLTRLKPKSERSRIEHLLLEGYSEAHDEERIKLGRLRHGMESFDSRP